MIPQPTTNPAEQKIKLQYADKTNRFGHHVIDVICYYLLIFLHAMVFDELLGILPKDGSVFFNLYLILLSGLYPALFEYFFSKTPGKFLTKTHVVTIEGGKPTFLNLLGRNFCRLIPFDALSFLGSDRGWHDQLSKTAVVYDN